MDGYGCLFSKIDPESLSAILDSVPAGISIATDASCKEIIHNPVAANFLRIDPWQSLSLSAPDPPPVKPLHQGKALLPHEMPIQRSAWKGESVKDFEMEFIWEDGVEKNASWSSEPLYDANGNIIGAVAALKDITGQKQLEQSLQKNKRREKLLSNVATNLLISDNPQDIVNELLLEISEFLECDVFFNYLVDEEKGCLHLNACSGIPHEEAKKIQRLDFGFAICGSVAQKGEAIVSSDILNRPDPKTALVRTYGVQVYACHPLKVGDQVIGTVSFGSCTRSHFNPEELEVMKNVADHIAIAMHRVKANQMLQDSEKRFRDLAEKLRSVDLYQSEERFYTIFRNSPDMITILKDKDNTFVEVNQRFLDVTEYTIEEVLGRTPQELNLWGERLILSAPSVNQYSYQENVDNIEYKIKTKSGKTVVILLSRETINLNGQLCLIYIMKDITSEKKIELEMARLDRLNLVGEMAASIGHEIRNPMTTVRGFLQMLGEKKECIQFRKYFQMMIGELDRANSIITEFLALAKNKTVQLKPQSLNVIVLNLFPLIQADALLTDKNIFIEPGDIPELLLDEKEIRQLVLNLVRNGLQAMSSGGKLTIRTFTFCDEVVLAIQDDGQGITPEVLERIGTPFFTTKAEGTGLGLAVCFSIAARHKAKIEIETSSQGTTFFVKFKTTASQMSL